MSQCVELRNSGVASRWLDFVNPGSGESLVFTLHLNPLVTTIQTGVFVHQLKVDVVVLLMLLLPIHQSFEKIQCYVL